MICFVLLSLWVAGGDAAFGTPTRSYDRALWQTRLPELRACYGLNKKIPSAYELEILIALSHYPELAEAHIHFKLTQNRVPATSRPRVAFLFGPRRARRYVVTISESDVWGASKAMIQNQSFDARIGLIGHELAHTAHYHRKRWWGFVGLGFAMMTERGRARFERATDRRAIEYGLGWQLHQWALELREGFSGTSWLDKHYMTPAEIEALLADN